MRVSSRTRIGGIGIAVGDDHRVGSYQCERERVLLS
jgi:hypothetical protein